MARMIAYASLTDMNLKYKVETAKIERSVSVVGNV